MWEIMVQLIWPPVTPLGGYDFVKPNRNGRDHRNICDVIIIEVAKMF